jgi:methionine-S-sulfoxide reductase
MQGYKLNKTLAMGLAAAALAWGGTDAMAGSNKAQATFGAGCFWCVEAVFEQLQGVEKVESGYSGGTGPTDYKEVCTGLTGHAEVVQITFDPDVITFRDLLTVLFSTHDPTTLNRQGGDVGTQYRSVIFYHDAAQKADAEAAVAALTEQEIFRDPIVTEISPFEHFYKAEAYHQNYYENNKTQGYCAVVINPKLKKFRQKFADKLKD